MKYLMIFTPIIAGVVISIYLYAKERDKRPVVVAFAITIVVLGMIIEELTLYGSILAMTFGFSIVYLFMSIIFIKVLPKKH